MRAFSDSRREVSNYLSHGVGLIVGAEEIGELSLSSEEPETDVSDEEYMAYENALVARWLELLDQFAKLPAHRLQAIVRMLEHHTDELAGVLRPRLLLPAVEE